jgi:glycosyltransferase involved in cell wall biosynthesis
MSLDVGARSSEGGMRVLSIGYTRGLWARGESDESHRLRRYAEGLDTYTVVVNSRDTDRLTELRIAPNFRAIPTGGRGPIANFLRMLAIGRRELDARAYDLIQAQEPIYVGVASWLLARRYGLPFNVCVYGPNPFDRHWIEDSALNRLLAPLARHVLRVADGVQVDGAQTERSLVANGIAAQRIRRKPMIPADLGDFLALKRAAKAPNDRVQLLFLGRFSRQKAVPLLFQALAEAARRTDVPFQLNLGGGGPLESEFRALAARAPVPVVFLGSLSRKETLSALSDADVLVLPSVYEGFPRVLLEAAAAGLPIVATRTSGSDELMVDGLTGFTTPIGSVAEFSERLARLIDDPELRRNMGANGRRHIQTEFLGKHPVEEQLVIWRAVTDGARASKGTPRSEVIEGAPGR